MKHMLMQDVNKLRVLSGPQKHFFMVADVRLGLDIWIRLRNSVLQIGYIYVTLVDQYVEPRVLKRYKNKDARVCMSSAQLLKWTLIADNKQRELLSMSECAGNGFQSAEAHTSRLLQ